RLSQEEGARGPVTFIAWLHIFVASFTPSFLEVSIYSPQKENFNISMGEICFCLLHYVFFHNLCGFVCDLVVAKCFLGNNKQK
ncbi:MAG: hypothetical protein JZU65_14655, partial [Chlorobium sp.]|nr:hypothetical protein [Chlorobium sp.]